MKTTKETGDQGEELALSFLRQNGYTIRHTKWRWGHKEIDIVASKGGILHIIEVKTRKTNALVDGAMAVNKQKQRNLVSAANGYVLRFNLNMDVVFDIISISLAGGASHIEFIENAFIPSWN